MRYRIEKIVVVAIAMAIAVAAIAIGAPPLTDEDSWNAAFCERIMGQTERRYDYELGHVLVDCETHAAVYEGGLDRRSSLDSVQQALFFASLTDKAPAVVIYDTDGVFGSYEYRICVGSALARVTFWSVFEEEGRLKFHVAPWGEPGWCKGR